MKTQAFDIISIGSLTVDIFLTPEEMTLSCQGEDELMSFPVGAKIPVEKTFKAPGGGAANTSVGFAKLGLKSAAIGVIGNDAEGIFIKKRLEQAHVSTDFLIEEKDSLSSFSVILSCPDGKRTVLHHKNSNPALSEGILTTLPKTRALYIGHLGNEAEGLLDELATWKAKHDVFLGWNPGTTQFKKGLHHFKTLLPAIDLLILNVEEAEAFTGLHAPSIAIKELAGEKVSCTRQEMPFTQAPDLREIAKSFLSTGVKSIIITDGKRGAQYFDQTGYHFFAPAQTTQPVSTLGAGDAFSIGSVAAALYGKSSKQQLCWGNMNADGVIRKFGAQEGQMTKKEIEAKLGL